MARFETEITHWLKRPVGRPSRNPKVFYHNLPYRAGSWDQACRVVVKIAWHAGELFPRGGFIVTNLKWRARRGGRGFKHPGAPGEGEKEGEENPARAKMWGPRG